MSETTIGLARAETGRLAWVMAGVAIALLPHLRHFAPWIPFAVFAAAAWRLIAAYWSRKLPATWLRVLLAVVGFAGVMWSYKRLTGVDAGTALLTVMLAMKILETRVSRDRLIIVFIAFFLIFAALLREQALWTIVYVVLATFANAAALLQAARIGPPLPATIAVRKAAGTCLLALPVMCLLFFVFPRVPGPFWALPPASGGAVTGLGASMSPGDISSLSTSDAVAMRVQFDGPAPAARQRYWRGPVFTIFDGRTWTAPAQRDYSRARTVGLDEAGYAQFDYSVSLEPHNQHWLLALETPTLLPEQSRITGRLQLVSDEPVRQVRHYAAQSVPATAIRTREGPITLAGLTKVPAGLNPRTRQWSATLRAESAGPRDYLERILAQFRNLPFYYTLTPATLGEHSVDEFLFQTREGFCEHYASSFAILARMAGIPARVVTGYQGAEHNPLLDYWIVRQSDAHAWVEVRLDGAWERFDPTAAVAPERIDLGLDAAITESELSAGQMLRTNPWVNGLVLSWDAVNAGWDRWVLGYGPELQASALRWLGFERPDLKHLAAATGIAMVISLVITGLFFSASRRTAADPVAKAYALFLRRAALAARPKSAAEGPSDYSEAIATLRPDLAAEVRRITGAYVRLRYEAAADNDELIAFRRLVRAFRPSASRVAAEFAAAVAPVWSERDSGSYRLSENQATACEKPPQI